LAKLTTSGRGEDNPVYVRELTPDPPLPSFPPTPAASPGRTAATNLEILWGGCRGMRMLRRRGECVRGCRRMRAMCARGCRLMRARRTRIPFGMGMPDPSAWSGEQQAQFLQALMGGGGAPALMPNASAAGGPGCGCWGDEWDEWESGWGWGWGKAPDVAPPKTLLQRLMPAVHFVAVWALLLYFLLVMEPGLHTVGGGEGETGGIGFAWRWKKLAAQAKGQLGAASGWGVQFILVAGFFWAFVTLELDAWRPPTILALALPHLPPRVSSVIVHGMQVQMQMGSMFMDDVAAVVVGIWACNLARNMV
ncbi:hypothetical protein R3P38DRAFT_2826882, partial [Favolaschia claudopus]